MPAILCALNIRFGCMSAAHCRDQMVSGACKLPELSHDNLEGHNQYHRTENASSMKLKPVCIRPCFHIPAFACTCLYAKQMWVTWPQLVAFFILIAMYPCNIQTATYISFNSTQTACFLDSFVAAAVRAEYCQCIR